jgi:hypothetical protein
MVPSPWLGDAPPRLGSTLTSLDRGTSTPAGQMLEAKGPYVSLEASRSDSRTGVRERFE